MLYTAFTALTQTTKRKQTMSNTVDLSSTPYIAEMRHRLGLSATDSSKDFIIADMSAMERAELVFGWVLGHGNWAYTARKIFVELGVMVEHPSTPKVD